MQILKNKGNRKGQISIVIFAILAVMLAASAMFIYYVYANNKVTQLKSPTIVSNLYEKEEMSKAFIFNVFKKAIISSKGEYSVLQENFEQQYDYGKLKSLLGSETDVKNIYPEFTLTNGDILELNITAKIVYNNSKTDVVYISHSFKISGVINKTSLLSS